MVHTGGIVPHPVKVREYTASGNRRIMQLAVGKTMRAVQQGFGRRPPIAMPVLTHPYEIAAIDAAGRDHHLLGRNFERRPACLVNAGSAIDFAALMGEPLDSLIEAQRQ